MACGRLRCSWDAAVEWPARLSSHWFLPLKRGNRHWNFTWSFWPVHWHNHFFYLYGYNFIRPVVAELRRRQDLTWWGFRTFAPGVADFPYKQFSFCRLGRYEFSHWLALFWVCFIIFLPLWLSILCRRLLTWSHQKDTRPHWCTCGALPGRIGSSNFSSCTASSRCPIFSSLHFWKSLCMAGICHFS